MKIAVLCTLIVIGISACKKTATGPAGPTGATGATGNSNVKLLVFGKDSITSTINNFGFMFPSTITGNLLDSSIVLAYNLHTNGFWYPAPGIGAASSYEMRMYYSSTAIYFQAYNLNGTSYSGGNNVFTKTKVLIVPSSDFSGHKLSPATDFKDYKATMKYFGLSED